MVGSGFGVWPGQGLVSGRVRVFVGNVNHFCYLKIWLTFSTINRCDFGTICLLRQKTGKSAENQAFERAFCQPFLLFEDMVDIFNDFNFGSIEKRC